MRGVYCEIKVIIGHVLDYLGTILPNPALREDILHVIVHSN